MIVDLIPHDPPRRDLNSSYPLRGRFWFVSVTAHVVWVSVAVNIPLSTSTSKRPIYDEFIRPLESRVLVYRPPKKIVPAAPEKQVGSTPDPRGKIVAPRTVIADAPKPRSEKQIVWKPLDAPEIDIDVPAPTVVARVEALPPPPPKIAPKQFIAPAVAKSTPKQTVTDLAATLASAPAISATPAPPASAATSLPPPPKIAPKQFTAPAVAKSEPKRTVTEVTAALAGAPALAASSVAPAPAGASLPAPPRIAPKQFTAPSVARSEPNRTVTNVTATLTGAAAVSVTPTASVPAGAALPPPPKVAPRTFVAPNASPSQPRIPAKTEVSEIFAAAAPLEVGQSSVVTPSGKLPPPPKVVPKQFQAPVAAGKGTQQATATVVNATLASAPQMNTAATVPSISTSRLPSPPSNLPPAPSPIRGNEQANLAVASVNPAPAAAVPSNPRSGQFSIAPTPGEPSSGTVPRTAVTVPNLAVREPSDPPKPPPANSTSIVYAERVRAASKATFAVPLRPLNRTVPRAIDAHFPGRTLYTVVIPIENLQAYSGDWILWFAESVPQDGTSPSIRAPVPVRKLEPVEARREPKDTRIQIAATIGVDGKSSNIRVLSSVSGAVQALAVEDLGSWEWKPATRNNVAISIDAIFEISFRLALRP